MYDAVHDAKALQELKFKELIKSNDKKAMVQTLFIERFSKEKYEILLKNTKKEELQTTLSNQIKNTIPISRQELESLAIQRVQNLQIYFVSNKLTLDRIQIKKEVVVTDSSDVRVFTLPLELNIKD